MMLDEIGVVFQAEFVRRIRSRYFLVGTLVGVVLMFVIATLPSFLERGVANASKRLIVAGPAQLTAPAVALLRRDDAVEITTILDAAEIPKTPTAAFLRDHGDAAALLVLAKTPAGLTVVAYARDAGVFPANRITRDLAPLQIAESNGLAPERITNYSPKTIDVRGVQGRYATSESADAARGVASFLVFLLYIVVLLNSQMLTTSVAEEKTSRIAELLVAAIPPSALLAGKVLATGLTGVLQLAVWAAAGIYLSAPLLSSGSPSSSAQTVLDIANALSPPIVAAFAGFFVLGFLQYALLFAGAASLISRTEDLGSVTVPMVLPAAAAVMIAQFALAAPAAPVVVASSFIPLVSPFVMFTRMLIADVPAWQVTLAFAINIGALAAIIPIAGKLYRVGLLLYGRAPKLRQIWAVLRS